MEKSNFPIDQDDWNTPKPEYIPRPTYMPVMFALGAVFTLFGIVTMWPMSVVGIILLVIALIGWIGEMRHDQRNEP